jgi:hypothetical protein
VGSRCFSFQNGAVGPASARIAPAEAAASKPKRDGKPGLRSLQLEIGAPPSLKGAGLLVRKGCQPVFILDLCNFSHA